MMEMDKENIQVGRPIEDHVKCTSLTRTPLQDVKGMAANIIKGHPADTFTPITPVSTPQHVGKNLRLGDRHLQVGEDGSGTPSGPSDIQLNQLVYQKVHNMYKTMKDDHTSAIEAKNTYINLLQAQLQGLKSCQDEDEHLSTPNADCTPDSSSTITPVLNMEEIHQEQHMDNTGESSVIQSFQNQQTMTLVLKTLDFGQMVNLETSSEDKSILATPDTLDVEVTAQIYCNTRDQGTSVVLDTQETKVDSSTMSNEEFKMFSHNNASLAPIMVECGVGQTPVKLYDIATETGVRCGTPVSVASAGVGTSPFCRGVMRPSQVRGELGVGMLCQQLETAAISNVLLREEVNQLQEQRVMRHNQLHSLEKRRQIWESQQDQLQTQSAMSKHLEQLMEQQGEQLQQISQLQTQLTAIEESETQLKTSNSTLQDDLCLAYRQHKKQVEALQCKYESKDYQPLYESALKQQRQLEAQLSAYSEISSLVPQVKQSQSILQQLISQSMKGIKQHRLSLQDDRKILSNQAVNIKKDRNEVDSKTAVLHEAEDTKMELEMTKHKLEDIVDSLSSLSTEKEMVAAELERVQAENIELQNEFSATHGELNQLQKDKIDTDLKNEQEKVNLLRTLDSREQEVDQLNQQQQHLQQLLTNSEQQLTDNDQMNKDIQNKLDTAMKELESAQEGQEFMEQEKLSLTEELKEKSSQLNKDTNQLHILHVQLATSKKENADLECELSSTKMKAQYMLLKQGAEINTSLYGANCLHQRLQALISYVEELMEKQDIENNDLPSSNIEEVKPDCRTNPSINDVQKAKRKSFVSSVLAATHDNLLGSPLPEIVESQEPCVKQQFSTSENSAFRKVATGTSNLSTVNENSRTETLSHHLNTSAALASKLRECINHLCETQKGGIEKMINHCDSLQMSLTQESKQNLSLHQSQSNMEAEHAKELQSSNQRERHLQNEVVRLREDVSSHQNQLRDGYKLLNERTERLAFVAEELEQAKRWKWEYERAEQQLREKEAELCSVQSTVNEHLISLRDNKNAANTEAAMRQIFKLRAENSKLLEQRLQEQESKDAALQKLARKVETYKKNWEKSEAEIRHLDEMFDRIRQSLRENLKVLEQCPSLQLTLHSLGITLNQEKSVQRTPTKETDV